MSARRRAPLHARCIREEEQSVPDDPFRPEYCEPVQAVVTALQGIDLNGNGGGVAEICDRALDLLMFIYDQPTAGLRYAALEGVVYNLVEALAPKPPPTT